MTAPDCAPTDEELLNEYLRTKDAGLLGTLYQRTHRKLCALALRLLGSPPDAEDVVQEVFCKLHDLKPCAVRSALSFLFRMVHNLAIDFKDRNGSGVLRGMISLDELMVKDEWLTRVADEWLDRGGWGCGPAPAEADEEERQANSLPEEVKAALADLPAAQREAVELYYARDITVAEMAEMLGISEGAAESAIFRGITTLRNALVPEEEQVPRRPLVRPVRAIDPDTGAVMREYATTTDAIRAGGSGRHLRRALKTGARYRGYVWTYANAV